MGKGRHALYFASFFLIYLAQFLLLPWNLEQAIAPTVLLSEGKPTRLVR